MNNGTASTGATSSTNLLIDGNLFDTGIRASCRWWRAATWLPPASTSAAWRRQTHARDGDRPDRGHQRKQQGGQHVHQDDHDQPGPARSALDAPLAGSSAAALPRHRACCCRRRPPRSASIRLPRATASSPILCSIGGSATEAVSPSLATANASKALLPSRLGPSPLGNDLGGLNDVVLLALSRAECSRHTPRACYACCVCHVASRGGSWSGRAVPVVANCSTVIEAMRLPTSAASASGAGGQGQHGPGRGASPCRSDRAGRRARTPASA